LAGFVISMFPGASPPLAVDHKDVMSVHINQVILASYSEYMKHHPNLTDGNISEPATGSYVCAVCQSSYTNKGNFKQHAEKHFKNGEFGPLNGNLAMPVPQMVPQLGNFGRIQFKPIPDLTFPVQIPAVAAACTSAISARAPTATPATSSSTS
jgi:hypothetical protein